MTIYGKKVLGEEGQEDMDNLVTKNEELDTVEDVVRKKVCALVGKVGGGDNEVDQGEWKVFVDISEFNYDEIRTFTQSFQYGQLLET